MPPSAAAERRSEQRRRARIEAVLNDKCWGTTKARVSFADAPSSGPPSPLVEETAHKPLWDPFDLRQRYSNAPRASYAEQLEDIGWRLLQTPLQNWSLTERLCWLLKQDVIMILAACFGSVCAALAFAIG